MQERVTLSHSLLRCDLYTPGGTGPSSSTATPLAPAELFWVYTGVTEKSLAHSVYWCLPKSHLSPAAVLRQEIIIPGDQPGEESPAGPQSLLWVKPKQLHCRLWGYSGFTQRRERRIWPPVSSPLLKRFCIVTCNQVVFEDQQHAAGPCSLLLGHSGAAAQHARLQLPRTAGFHIFQNLSSPCPVSLKKQNHAFSTLPHFPRALPILSDYSP